MGRESRQPRQPDVTDRGDAGRILMAHGTCVKLVCYDLRVQQFYEAWRAERDRVVAAGPPPSVTSLPYTEALAHIERLTQQRREGEVDALAALLRGMGVPWRWAADVLITVMFGIVTHNTQHPEDPQVLHVSTMSPLSARPVGRKPRHHGTDVRQWVEWWYRHEVKHPADSVYKLAQEYAAREKRHTRADSVVEDGIQRAKNLLNRDITPIRGASPL